MFIIDKTIKTLLLCGVIVIVGWYLFDRFSTKDLHGNGTTVNDIRNELNQVKEYQSATKERYDNIEKQVADSIERIEVMSDRFEEADRIIKQCESIIDDIRKTGKEQN